MAAGLSACCVLILSIIAIVMLGFLVKRDSNTNNVVTDLENNFQSRAIMDIKSSDSNQCPSGYESMFNFEFPGTDYVCLCVNDKTGKKRLESVYTTGCVLVSGYTCKKTKMEKGLLSKYRGKHLCAKRSEHSYEGYTLVAKNGNCPDGQRTCGFTSTKRMCLASTETCPLNSIIISKNDLTAEQIANFSYRTIHLDDGYKLYYSNKATGSHIPTEFKLSYDPPCISPDEVKVPEDYDVSALDGTRFYVSECKNKYGTDSAYDNRWKKEDNHSRARLFNENNYLVNYESSRILNMTHLDSTGHFLYSRGYADWDRKCTSDSSVSVHDNFNSLTSTQKGESKRGLSIAGIILFLIAAISAIIWLVYIFGKSENKNPVNMCCWAWLCIILVAAVVCTALLFMRTNKDYPKNHKNWTQEGCGDDMTSSIVKKVVDGKTSFWRYALGGLILGALALLALCCTCCCLRKTKHSYDPMRENTYSAYTELKEDNQYQFNPNSQGAYPEVKSKQNTVYEDKVYTYQEPEVNREYVKAQPAYKTVEVKQAEPTYVNTTYVQPEPVVRTEYVKAEPTYTNTTYVNAEPTYTNTTYVKADPVVRTEYVKAEPTYTNTTYVKAEPTYTNTTYVNAEPNYTSNVKYIQGEPTTTYISGGGNTTGNVRYLSSSGREITREEAYGSNSRY